MRQENDRIEVNKKTLVDFVVQKCGSHFYNNVEGECCLRKTRKGICDLHVFAEELHCPLDCPRLETKEYRCDRGKCPHVRAVIKNLKT